MPDHSRKSPNVAPCNKRHFDESLDCFLLSGSLCGEKPNWINKRTFSQFITDVCYRVSCWLVVFSYICSSSNHLWISLSDWCFNQIEYDCEWIWKFSLYYGLVMMVLWAFPFDFSRTQYHNAWLNGFCLPISMRWNIRYTHMWHWKENTFNAEIINFIYSIQLHKLHV